MECQQKHLSVNCLQITERDIVEKCENRSLQLLLSLLGAILSDNRFLLLSPLPLTDESAVYEFERSILS